MTARDPRILVIILMALGATAVHDSVSATAFPVRASGGAPQTVDISQAPMLLNAIWRRYRGYHGHPGYYGHPGYHGYPRSYGYRGYGGGYGYNFYLGPGWGYQDPYYYTPDYAPPDYSGYDDSHLQWCLNRYRSYEPRTNTFLGYDGYRHPCIGSY